MKQVLLLSITTCLLINFSFSQNCLLFANKQCVICVRGYHLYESNCVADVPNCQNYVNGTQCFQCKNGFDFIVSNKSCVVSNKTQNIISPNIQPKTDDSVRNAAITPDQTILGLLFQQYLNTTKFRQTQIYSKIKQLLLSKIENSKIRRVQIAQNQTHTYYQIQYKMLKQLKYQFFTIKYIKRSSTYSLVKQNQVLESKVTRTQYLNGNRDKMIAQLEYPLNNIQKYLIPTFPEYSYTQRLIEITKSQFLDYNPLSKKQQTMTSFTFKYKFDKKKSTKHQFIQYRFTLNSLVMDINGPVLFAFQKWTPVVDNKMQIIKSILIYAENNIFKKQKESELKYQIVSIFNSSERILGYRVQFKITDSKNNINKNIIYDIDFNINRFFAYQEINNIVNKDSNNLLKSTQKPVQKSAQKPVQKFTQNSINIKDTPKNFAPSKNPTVPPNLIAQPPKKSNRPILPLIIQQTIIDVSARPVLGQRCKTRSKKDQSCLQCKTQLLLCNDGKCYIKLLNCLKQDKSQCTECDKGFKLNLQGQCE